MFSNQTSKPNRSKSSVKSTPPTEYNRFSNQNSNLNRSKFNDKSPLRPEVTRVPNQTSNPNQSRANDQLPRRREVTKFNPNAKRQQSRPNDQSTPPRRSGRRRRRWYKARPKKNKKKRLYPKGIAYIKASSNNTIVNITNLLGKALCWTSAGSCGFRGARKSTNFAAKKTGQKAAQKAVDKNKDLKQLEIRLRGLGRGRETAIRGLVQGGTLLCLLRDVNGFPYNGCRAPKKRRL